MRVWLFKYFFVIANVGYLDLDLREYFNFSFVPGIAESGSLVQFKELLDYISNYVSQLQIYVVFHNDKGG